MNALYTTFLAGACALGGAAFGQVSIDEFAPESSFVVMTAEDASAALDAIKGTSLGDLWRDGEFSAWREAVMAKPLAQFQEAMEAVGVMTIDDLSPPSAVGLAAFLVEGEQVPAQEGMIIRAPRVLASADFGDGAEAVMDAIERVVDRMEEGGTAATTRDSYRDADILAIELLEEQADEEQDPEEFVPPPGAWEGMGGFGPGDTLWIATLDGFIVASDEQSAVEHAIDAALGDDVDSVGDTSVYQEALRQHPDGQQARAVVLFTEDLQQLLVQSMGFISMIAPGTEPKDILDALGVLAVRAVGMGVTIDADDGLVEMTQSVLVPDKRGLVALVAGPPVAFTPPHVIGADAADVTMLSVNFDDIVPLARDVLGTLTLNEQMQAQATGAVNAFAAMVGPLLDELGPEVWIATDYQKPYSATSQSVLIASPVGDELIAKNTQAILMGQAQGMFEPQEFEGATIYAMPDGSFAHTVAYGYVMLGSLQAVRDAVRQAANPEGPALATEPRFKDAARLLDGETVSASYVDMAEQLHWTAWQMEHRFDIIEEQIRSSTLPKEVQDKWLDSMRDQFNAADRPPPIPADAIARYVGDVVTELHATPDGFRGRMVILRPED